MGFYRHDQWGLLALLTIHGVYRTSSPSGVITVSEALLPEQPSTRGATNNLNAQAHDHVVHYVIGIVCGTFDLNEVCCIGNANSNSICYLN